MFRAGNDGGTSRFDSSGKRAFPSSVATAATIAAGAAIGAAATTPIPPPANTLMAPSERSASNTAVELKSVEALDISKDIQDLVDMIKSGNLNHGGGRQAKGGRWMGENTLDEENGREGLTMNN